MNREGMMADKKKTAKSSKAMGKKDMKKTKGGMNFNSKVGAVQNDFNFNQASKVSPGQISSCDGSV